MDIVCSDKFNKIKIREQTLEYIKCSVYRFILIAFWFELNENMHLNEPHKNIITSMQCIFLLIYLNSN